MKSDMCDPEFKQKVEAIVNNPDELSKFIDKVHEFCDLFQQFPIPNEIKKEVEVFIGVFAHCHAQIIREMMVGKDKKNEEDFLRYAYVLSASTTQFLTGLFTKGYLMPKVNLN